MGRRCALAAASLSWFFAACETMPEPDGAARRPIVNGQTDLGDPAIVALTVQGQHFCTGTVVSKRVVVTAAHCLPPNVEFLSSVTEIEIFFGSSVEPSGGSFIPVVAGMAHPGWTIEELPDDIGVLALAQDAPVAPIPLPATPLLQSLVGGQVRIVGYGVTSESGMDNGLKREGLAQVMDLDSASITIGTSPGITCYGDSGGPLLLDRGGGEEIIGIHSRSDCVGFALDERVDRHITGFIQPFIDQHQGGTPSCDADGQCAGGCAEPDPDCPCAADGLCTAACGDPLSDPDCPSCAQDGQCVMDCMPVADPDCPVGPVCGDADGMCPDGCTEMEDEDCGAGAEDVGGGCGCRAGSESGSGGLAALGLALLLMLRRRRAAGTRR